MASASAPSQSGGSKKGFVFVISIVSALGGLLFGYDIGVIAGALPFIAESFGLSNLAQGVVTSSLLVGAAVGALAAGNLSDRFGRRKLLLVAAVVFVIGAVGSAFAPGTLLLIVARFVLGLAVGGASLVVPLYIAEMTPPENRGALVSLNQLMITIGILISYLVSSALTPAEAWRWMLGLALVPAVFLGIGMLFLPDTPRWFVSKRLFDRARAVLQRSRDEQRVEPELNEISEIEEQERREARGWGELTQPWVRPMIVVGVGLAITQQITGINTIIYFAPTILQATGLGSLAAIVSTVGIGTVNVLITVLAIALIDRVGRRPLLLVGLGGMVVSVILLGAVYLLPSLQGVVGYAALFFIVAYVAFYAVSLGPVVWLMISEIYPLSVRGSAMSISTISLWLANTVVALTFLSLFGALGLTITFWIFAVIGVAAWFFVFFLVPETKQRSLEEIEADLKRKNPAAQAS